MKESTLLENFEKQASALRSGAKNKDRMMEAMANVMSFSDDQQSGAKYVEALFNSADAVDDYLEQKMRVIAFLKDLATLIRKSAQKISLTEGETNEPPGEAS